MDVKLCKWRNKFAVDLYQALSKSSGQNIIISPVGLKIILATILQGARGVTAAEIAKVLNLREYKKYFINYEALISDFEKHHLKLTTQIFIEKTYTISSEFQYFMNKFSLSEIHGVDLKNQAVKEINDCIAKSTNQEIKGLLSFDVRSQAPKKQKTLQQLLVVDSRQSVSITYADRNILRSPSVFNIKLRSKLQTFFLKVDPRTFSQWQYELLSGHLDGGLESIRKVASLVLACTVLMKPHCDIKIQKIKTLTMPFYIKPNLTVDAEMMILREKRFCTMKSRKLGAQIVEMPFAENKLSMIIILPKKTDGLADVESKLGCVDISQELSELWLSKVNLYLPKFKLEQTIEMNDFLSKIGMPTAFSDKANFSGISTSRSLAIGCIIHKVLLEVQEAGIDIHEEGELNSYGRAPLNVLTEVKCDHPFLFIILAQREVLFIGRLQNPKEI